MTIHNFVGECQKCHAAVFLPEDTEKPNVIECGPCSGKGKWVQE